MLSKKKLLRNSKLYLILDAQVNDYEELFNIAQKSVRYGVDIIQLRDKTGSAKDILKLSRRIRKVIGKQALYIINDRVDLAIEAEASGVHLGQDDIPIKVARRIMGKDAIIGASCQSFQHAKLAEKQGADYIGFGSVFKTLTKPERHPMPLELLTKVVQDISIPVFAIGGINLENCGDIKAIGVDRVAVCRAVCQSKRLKQTISDFKEILG